MLNSSIVDLALLGENGNRVNLNGDVETYAPLYDLPEMAGAIHFLDAQEFHINTKTFRYQIVAMPVYDFQSPGGRFVGVLFLAIDPTTFLGQTDTTAEYATQVVLLNGTGAPLLGSGDARDALLAAEGDGAGGESFEAVLDGARYNVLKSEVRALGGTLYVLVSQSAYQQQMNFMSLVQALLIVLEFVAAVGIMFAFFNLLTRSLSGLTGLMQRIGSGRARVDERVRLEPNARLCREVVDIAQAFNGMMDEIEHLNRDILENYKRMYTLEAANRQTEIAFLRSQINPHFLYNTLTLICGMAAGGGRQGRGDHRGGGRAVQHLPV